MARQHWDSRLSFIMAATGSAIGLGNVWRFPFVCYQNGGGAFLIPFFIAMFTIGIPLLMVEFGLGRMAGGGAPKAMAFLHRRMAWVGWLAVFAAFVVVTYYAVIMAWSFNYFYHSLTLAWGKDAGRFFNEVVLHKSAGITPLGGVQWPVFIGLVLTWLSIVGVLWKGVKSVARVVMITVPLPAVLLVILIVRGLTLPGAMEGLHYYLSPDFTKLMDPTVWIAAYGQILFSFSLGQAVLIAYASFLPKRADVNKNSVIVAFADSFFSFIAGFAVFSTLGYLAVITHMGVGEVVNSGPGLAFVTYPTAIRLLPFARPFFGVIFFLMLLTLGIDSAFALVEGVVAGIADYCKRSSHTILLAVSSIAFLIGILFTTRAGYYWLDIVDHFINNFGLVAIALGECIAVGWVWGARRFRLEINATSDFSVGWGFDLVVKWVAPLMLSVMFVLSLVHRLRSPYGGYPFWAQAVAGWGIVLAALLLALFLGWRTGKERA